MSHLSLVRKILTSFVFCSWITGSALLGTGCILPPGPPFIAPPLPPVAVGVGAPPFYAGPAPYWHYHYGRAYYGYYGYRGGCHGCYHWHGGGGGYRWSRW